MGKTVGGLGKALSIYGGQLTVDVVTINDGVQEYQATGGDILEIDKVRLDPTKSRVCIYVKAVKK